VRVLSSLQLKILRILASGESVQMRDVVSKCFGALAYGRSKEFRSGKIVAVKNGEYQAAYASTSRAIRRLEARGLVERLSESETRVVHSERYGEMKFFVAGGTWRQIKLTEQGKQTVKAISR
jgi:hypothetical protein